MIIFSENGKFWNLIVNAELILPAHERPRMRQGVFSSEIRLCD